MKIKVREFNVETQQEIISERDLSSEELKEIKDAEIALQLKNEADAKNAINKAALLAKLGITESEAALLLS